MFLKYVLKVLWLGLKSELQWSLKKNIHLYITMLAFIKSFDKISFKQNKYFSKIIPLNIKVALRVLQWSLSSYHNVSIQRKFWNNFRYFFLAEMYKNIIKHFWWNRKVWLFITIFVTSFSFSLPSFYGREEKRRLK